MSYKNYIRQFIQILDQKKILSSIFMSKQFSDEPKLYSYSAHMKVSTPFSDGFPYVISGHGHSFVSKEEALFKALVEGIERFPQICYRDKNMIFSSYASLKKHALDPNLYLPDSSVWESTFGWRPGYDLLEKKDCLIPGQLTYLNWNHMKEEPMLSDNNSTGAAAGFDHESTLLRALCEGIERDSFMTTYLISAPLKKIAVEKINDPEIQIMLQRVKRYNFEIHVFDMTTDLLIPSYLTILVDRTGLGPCLTMGTKASLDKRKAIIGSMGEAFQSRTWIRTAMIKRKENFRIDPKTVITMKQRAYFWTPLHMLSHFDYLLKQKPTEEKLPKSPIAVKEQLAFVLSRLQEKNMHAYYADMQIRQLKATKIFVYKSIVPEFHPLALHEIRKTFRPKRLAAVAAHYGMKSYTINPVPQPFL